MRHGIGLRVAFGFEMESFQILLNARVMEFDQGQGRASFAF
jgi:hypothetical protein